MVVRPERNSGVEQKDGVRPSIPTCLTRKRVAPTAGELTKTTPVANHHSRKRAAPPTAAGHSTNTVPVPKRSIPRLNHGKQKRNAPDHLVRDPTRNQATVTNQSPAKVKASHGKTSCSATRHSSRRTVSDHLKSTNNAAIEPIASVTDISWEEYFDRLVEFKWNHGHCLVPVDICVDDSYHLGQWVVVQRLQHNRLVDGRPSSIKANQVERLNSIGFVWKVR